MTRTKPHFVVVAGRPMQVGGRETKLQSARRRYGQDFGAVPMMIGEGPRYWTIDRVSQLAARNEEDRMRRRNLERKPNGKENA